MKQSAEKGQALLVVVAAMGVLLVGAVGLALDGSQLYAHGQMAQSAADAIAMAGIMDIFNGTNVGANAFGSSAHTCTSTDAIAPCKYAVANGFGNDTVILTFGDKTNAPEGFTSPPLSPTDSPCWMKVSITRNVSTTLMRMFGAGSTTQVKATALASIVSVVAPVPIIITHPTKASALSMGGNDTIQITGGPSRSIQVNSNSATAFGWNGNSFTIDLHAAGPSGTGADFGVYGAESQPGQGTWNLGTGRWLEPAAPIQDPFANVQAPDPSKLTAQSPACGSSCSVYQPGIYDGGLTIKNATSQLKPGVYYIKNGDFSVKNSTVTMGSGSDPDTGQGVLIYHTGTGAFDIDTKANITLVGAGVTPCSAPCSSQTTPSGPYYGILLFQDRTTPNTVTHTIGKANGCISLQGTIYITNTLALMKSGVYQETDYQGGPCSNTMIQGEIVTSVLAMQGNSTINMQLMPNGTLPVRQVALIGGGPHL
ncbi:MAG: Tad domain-containing protein [Bryobacteraceae bacterium]